MIIDSYVKKLPRRKKKKKKKESGSGEKTLWFFAGITTSCAVLLALFLKIC